MKITIVAPVHIQPSEKWVEALEREAKVSGADVIIVDDSNGKVKLPFDCYDYARQRKELGGELYAQFEQFHKSAACKQFGLWLAYKRGYDVVIVIDSDCIVSPGFIEWHLVALRTEGEGWANPLYGTGLYSRGFPFSKRIVPKWAHMGLWTNELDLYGADRVKAQSLLPTTPEIEGLQDAQGAHFPLSGMNVSFVREAIPYMLFLPNFVYEGEKFTRHDDIWGGYIFQKFAHAHNKALSYGYPWVYHDTVVIPEEDAKAEEPMVKYEDKFYEFINDTFITSYWKDDDIPRIFENLGFFLGETEEFAGLEPACLFWANALSEI